MVSVAILGSTGMLGSAITKVLENDLETKSQKA
jgi:aspartate-semialdehyde dehydrogenase